tara:strand:- start:1029 stop:1295 length:267 start_codon:yes stop_codon:yes gene_type:complete
MKRNHYIKSIVRIGSLVCVSVGLVWLVPGGAAEMLTQEVTLTVGELVVYCLVGLLGILSNSFIRDKRGSYWSLHYFLKREFPIRSKRN